MGVQGMTALLRNEADMIAAYQARIQELQLTYATVDAISGLPDGYTAKLMAKMKGLGEKAIEGLNGALGVGFVVAVDREQCAKVETRWVRRKRPFYALERGGQACRASIKTTVQIMPELQGQLEKREYMKRIGKLGASKGGKRRAKTMGKRARQRAAQHAARMRWSKSKSPGRTVCD
jgi:hypothetical protein